MRFVSFASALSWVVLLAGAAQAQSATRSWPQRPVTFVVGFAAGGSTDVVARLVAARLEPRLKTQIIVENRAGASGVVAQSGVARAMPDGYTFLFGSGTMAANANLMKDLSFDTATSFAPVTQVTNIPAVLCVSAAFPPRTLAELVDYVKAHPGQVNYGSAGSGTLQHVAGAMFEKMIGGSLVHVPYRGGGPANIDLAAGRLQMIFGPVVELQSYIQSGQARVLGITTPTRSATYPSAEPVADAVPGYEIATWHAVLAPKDTPPEIVDQMQRAIAEVVAEPETKARFLDLGLEPIGSRPAEFGAFLKSEIRRWKDLTALAGLQPQ